MGRESCHRRARVRRAPGVGRFLRRRDDRCTRSKRAFPPEAAHDFWVRRYLRGLPSLILVAVVLVLRSGAEAPLPPPPTSVFSVAEILRQDGAGLPTTWGREDGWEAPAWYWIKILLTHLIPKPLLVFIYQQP